MALTRPPRLGAAILDARARHRSRAKLARRSLRAKALDVALAGRSRRGVGLLLRALIPAMARSAKGKPVDQAGDLEESLDRSLARSQRKVAHVLLAERPHPQDRVEPRGVDELEADKV